MFSQVCRKEDFEISGAVFTGQLSSGVIQPTASVTVTVKSIKLLGHCSFTVWIIVSALKIMSCFDRFVQQQTTSRLL